MLTSETEQSLNKKYCITHADAFVSLCQPFLQTQKIYHCSYVRTYTDGTEIVLTTHPGLAIDFVTKNFVDHCDYINDCRRGKKSNYYFFSAANDDEQKVHTFSREKYQIGDGLGIINNYPKFQEQFYVAHHIDATARGEGLLAKLPAIEQYLTCFRDQAEHLITDSEQDRIPLPGFELGRYLNYEDTMLRLINQRSGGYDLSSNCHLSQREYLCCQLWLNGQTTVEIAASLGLTPHTVHLCVEKVKRQLGCDTQHQMFLVFARMFRE